MEYGLAPLPVERVGIWELRRHFRWEAPLDEVARLLSGAPWEHLRAGVLRTCAEATSRS